MSYEERYSAAKNAELAFEAELVRQFGGEDALLARYMPFEHDTQTANARRAFHERAEALRNA